MNTQSLDAWEPEVAARGVPDESPKKDLFDMSKRRARGWGDTSQGQQGCARAVLGARQAAPSPPCLGAGTTSCLGWPWVAQRGPPQRWVQL